MQENFTRKIHMTTGKMKDIAKCVKILVDAISRFGSIPDLHRALIKDGIEISDTALYNAEKGVAKSLKPDVIVAICHLVYDGDWKKCGKALEEDFRKK